jgi:hypothetical protein
MMRAPRQSRPSARTTPNAISETPNGKSALAKFYYSLPRGIEKKRQDENSLLPSKKSFLALSKALAGKGN